MNDANEICSIQLLPGVYHNQVKMSLTQMTRFWISVLVVTHSQFKTMYHFQCRHFVNTLLRLVVFFIFGYSTLDFSKSKFYISIKYFSFAIRSSAFPQMKSLIFQL